MPTLTTLQADIATQAVDAIVNAANTTLLGGGGVDGAIHAAAGPALLSQCANLPELDPELEPGVRCRVGEAKLTRGYLLPARFVIHTVGPIWSDDDPLAGDGLLAACYRNCISLAGTHQLKSIAFPCISTGAFGFPFQRAAQIAVTTVRQALFANRGIEDVRFVCFSGRDLAIYKHLLRTGS